MIRPRDLRQGRRLAVLPLSRGRSERPDHRRIRLDPPGRSGCAGVLCSSDVLGTVTGRDDDRPGAGLPRNRRGPRAGSATLERAVREQRCGGRSRATESQAATNAWAEDDRLDTHRRERSCLRAESPPRPATTRSQRRSSAPRAWSFPTDILSIRLRMPRCQPVSVFRDRTCSRRQD